MLEDLSAHVLDIAENSVRAGGTEVKITIDEDIAVLNTERGEAISSILEKQRGVSYAKKLYAKVAARVDKRESDKQAS